MAAVDDPACPARPGYAAAPRFDSANIENGCLCHGDGGDEHRLRKAILFELRNPIFFKNRIS